jgi:hypothetical protein
MPILGTIASSYKSSVATAAFESIATVTVGSGGSYSIGFSNIPQTFTHLQVRGIVRSNRGSSPAEGFNLRINDNSSTVYTYHRLYGDGSTTVADGEGGNSGMPFGGIPASTAPASVYGAVIFDILDYTNTNKYKTIRQFTAHDRNGAGFVGVGSGLYYANTNAITEFYFYGSSSENFSQHSTLALYGIKVAQ